MSEITVLKEMEEGREKDVTSQALEYASRDKERRDDKPKTVCTRCPHAVWQATGTDLICYCRVMYRLSWSKAQPTEILACDGLVIPA